MVEITNHAKKRFKERLGLPKSACQKQAETAYERGFSHKDAKGRARRYLDSLWFRNKRVNNLKVYGGAVYLFNNNTLITVFSLPKNMLAGFKN